MTRLPMFSALIGIVVLAPSLGRAGHEDIGCGECHIVHMSPGQGSSLGSGLWNTAHTTDELPTFTLYSSPSFDALGTDISQPDGPSKLCLGCHDGSFGNEAAFTTQSAVFDASDLSRSHPISFTYDSLLASRVRNGTLRDPVATSSGLGGTIATDLLDDNGKMQCTSCHDVHAGSQGAKLLRYPYGPDATGDQRLCRVCHNR